MTDILKDMHKCYLQSTIDKLVHTYIILEEKDPTILIVPPRTYQKFFKDKDTYKTLNGIILQVVEQFILGVR